MHFKILQLEFLVVYIPKFATRIFTAEIRVVCILNLQLELLPQKSESAQIFTAKVQVKIQNPSCAFQNLQLGIFRVDTWLPSERSGYPLPQDG